MPSYLIPNNLCGTVPEGFLAGPAGHTRPINPWTQLTMADDRNVRIYRLLFGMHANILLGV